MIRSTEVFSGMVEIRTRYSKRWPKKVTLKSGRAVVIRQARPSDAVGLIEFRTHVFEEAGEFLVTQAGEYRQTFDELERIIAHYLYQPNALMLLAFDVEAAAQPVAEITFSGQMRRRSRHVGEFGMTSREAYWDSGIGTLLLTELLSWAGDHPFVEKVTCEVFETNPRARALYEKLGFKEEGRLLGQYRRSDGKGYIDSIVMGLWLDKSGVSKS